MPLIVSVRASNQGWWAFCLTTGAVLWGLALIVGALVVPAYSGSASDSAGHVWTTTATLVQANGVRVLMPVSVPAVCAVLLWMVLHRRCSRGGQAALAWALTGLLCAFALVAVSIGVFVLPLVALLAVGVHLTPNGPARSAQA